MSVPWDDILGLPPWRRLAACKGQLDLMIDGPQSKAKLLCRGCPVRQECLAFALETEPSDGIWGGKNWKERLLLCPVCLRVKRGPTSDLGCGPVCTQTRIAHYEWLAAGGAFDVEVSQRREPTMRTNPYCPRPRGDNHSSSRAYKDGCRCQPSRDARRAEAQRLRLQQKEAG